MKHYIGITVGPIFDTISDATVPATLWFASTLFSDLTRRICFALDEKDGEGNAVLKELKLYSPFLDPADSVGLADGVGKYHDRIIFSVENMEKEEIREKLDRILVTAKKETLGCIFPVDDRLNKQKEFLETYIQLPYVILTDEQVGDVNCILKITPYLDAMELMKTFPLDDMANPIRQVMFDSVNKKANAKIKETPLFKSTRNNQLIKEGSTNICQIEEIARSFKRKADVKFENYYAMVAADADGMGNFLKSISNDEVVVFSECCLEYAKKASTMIKDFCGMTIYAGGDDLLFLAPVQNGTKNIYTLCMEISNVFTEILKKKEVNGKRIFEGKEIPTVSFGISIQFQKSPLYEAQENARALLYKAKSYTYSKESKKPEKNCVVLSLSKHSGQSIEVLIGNECCDRFETTMTFIQEHFENDMIKGILSKLELFYPMIDTMDRAKKPVLQGQGIDEDVVKMFWDNLFDNEGQKFAEAFTQELCRTYYCDFVRDNLRYVALKEVPSNDNKEQTFKSLHMKSKERANQQLNVLIELLRYFKFLKEAVGER